MEEEIDGIIAEEVIENVEDTSVNETVELTNTEDVDTSENVEVKEEPQKTFTQEQIDKIVEGRINREKREHQKELSKYKSLANTLQVGMGENDLDTLQNNMKKYYKEQGIEIPEDKPYESERDQVILAKEDAKEIMELGLDEMEKEANKIAIKPREQRSIRENTIFNELCSKLVMKKSEIELEKKGIDPRVLKDDSFKKFASKFSSNTPVLEIHEMYSKINHTIEKPKSTGSVKTSPNESAIKEFYTPEEASKFTMKDYDNPKLMKAVDNSRLLWK